jgi:hypothetical protein
MATTSGRYALTISSRALSTSRWAWRTCAATARNSSIWEADALCKRRELPAHLGDRDGIVAIKRVLLFDPAKLQMLMLQHTDQISDPIRVQFQSADFPGVARQEIVQLDAIPPRGAPATSQRAHPLLAEGRDLPGKRGNALHAPHRLR